MTELSRPVPLDRIGASGGEQVVEATPEECAALARRLMIPAVHRLRCAFQLRRAVGAVIDAEGELDAEVVQMCVASLDEFAQEVRERFGVQFVPAGTETEDDDPESPDQIPYSGTAIDLGEAAAEQLALALDPYPRKPGVAFEPPEADDDTASPFERLRTLSGREEPD